MPELRVAIVGCGAAAELVHLPVISRFPEVDVTVLVDPSLERAQRLAAAFDVPRVVGSYELIQDEIDAAVVALPHHLHAQICTDLLAKGTHVLVEKPMALTVEEGKAMIRASERTGSVLGVGHLRRLFPSSLFVERILKEQFLGPLVGFEVREGRAYDWQVASDFGFRPGSGGGVMFDLGAHVLDLLLFWLGDLNVLSYMDDAMGGVESDAYIELRRGPDAVGVVELSRTRQLKNVCLLRGERATLQVKSEAGDFNPEISLTIADQKFRGKVETSFTRWHDVISEQFRRFVLAVRGEGSVAVSGYDALKVVELIQRCHADRKSWVYPWLGEGPRTRTFHR